MTEPHDPTYEALDDNELMRRGQQGDSRAFDALVQRHASLVFNFVLRACGDRSIAEDLLQETFLRAYRAARSWHAEARVTTWILTIARNLVADRFRWLKRWRTVPLNEDDLPGSPELKLVRDDPEEQVLLREDHDELRRALLELPERHREVLLLSRYGGLSYAEIARATGSTEDAVKQRAYRALLELRRSFLAARSSKERTHATALRKPGP